MGPAIYFDGRTSARHAVTVEIEQAVLVVRDAIERHILARWPHHEIERLAAPDRMVRLGRTGTGLFTRIEIREPTFAKTMSEFAATVRRSGDRRGRTRAIVWSLAAVASLLMVGIFGVPAIGERL